MKDRIIEVVQCSAKTANRLMKAGYVLLGVFPTSSMQAANGQFFVRHAVSFVVGCPEGVPPVPDPAEAVAASRVAGSSGE